MSDYDILVVTDGISDKEEAGMKLDTVDNLYYKYPERSDSRRVYQR